MKMKDEGARLRKKLDRQSRLEHEAALQARREAFLEKVTGTRYVPSRIPVDPEEFARDNPNDER